MQTRSPDRLKEERLPTSRSLSSKNEITFYLCTILACYGVFLGGTYLSQRYLEWLQAQQTITTPPVCPTRPHTLTSQQLQNILHQQQLIRSHQINAFQTVVTHHPIAEERKKAREALKSFGIDTQPLFEPIAVAQGKR